MYNFSKHSCVLGLQFKQIVKAPGPLVCIFGLNSPFGGYQTDNGDVTVKLVMAASTELH